MANVTTLKKPTLDAARAFAELSTAHQEAGSVGESWVISRQVVAGYREVNTSDNTIKYYAGDATTLLLTVTKAQATGSPTITFTPS